MLYTNLFNKIVIYFRTNETPDSFVRRSKVKSVAVVKNIAWAGYLSLFYEKAIMFHMVLITRLWMAG